MHIGYFDIPKDSYRKQVCILAMSISSIVYLFRRLNDQTLLFRRQNQRNKNFGNISRRAVLLML